MAAAAPLLVGAAGKKQRGLDLYSLRSEIAEDLPGTLALVRKMGFEETEAPSL